MKKEAPFDRGEAEIVENFLSRLGYGVHV